MCDTEILSTLTFFNDIALLKRIMKRLTAKAFFFVVVHRAVAVSALGCTCCDQFTLTEASRCRGKTVVRGGDSRLTRVRKIFFILWRRCSLLHRIHQVFTVLFLGCVCCYRCCRFWKLVFEICGRVLLRRKVVRSIGVGAAHIRSGRSVPVNPIGTHCVAFMQIAKDRIGIAWSKNLVSGIYNLWIQSRRQDMANTNAILTV